MPQPTLALVPFVGEVHRVARRGDVFGFRPYDSALFNRWDDPEGTFHVIYAAETLEGAFIEYLGDFRYAEIADQAMDEIRENDEPWVETEMRSGQVDRALISMSFVGRASIRDGSSAVIADHADTLTSLEPSVRRILDDLKIARLNVSSILSDNRRLTCAISRIFFQDHRIGGIRCGSKYGSNYVNWTLYEGDHATLKTRVECAEYGIEAAGIDMPALRTAMEVLRIVFAPLSETKA